MTVSKKQGILAGLLLLLTGVVVTYFWFTLQNPMKPLYVEIYNQTDETLPSVEIEHGNAQLQEKIMLIQLSPGERRVIALNHKPGQGFNVAANYAHREKSEICAGKSKDHWFFRQTITPVGIYSTPIR